jgi:NAD(P)-dependent dehydrogenase (short-subunit alcohol dehydrogenase family)
MLINCEAPFFLTTALYPYMESQDGVAGRVLHVSSGAAHGAPPVGWSCYGITKAAFFQSYRVLQREFGQLGGKVVVGSFKPGVVDTSMQGTIREAPETAMPVVSSFITMKDKVAHAANTSTARPPPTGALDAPENVAFFAEYLLVGTTDEEFANTSDLNEYDIRDSKLFPHWIPEENLP